ncbi:hypothetical protein K1719_045872 [Acacia pycnantha]|nr:hypothetical protein K1719_045872 [Acacia pycnantha]
MMAIVNSSKVSVQVSSSREEDDQLLRSSKKINNIANTSTEEWPKLGDTIKSKWAAGPSFAEKLQAEGSPASGGSGAAPAVTVEPVTSAGLRSGRVGTDTAEDVDIRANIPDERRGRTKGAKQRQEERLEKSQRERWEEKGALYEAPKSLKKQGEQNTCKELVLVGPGENVHQEPDFASAHTLDPSDEKLSIGLKGRFWAESASNDPDLEMVAETPDDEIGRGKGPDAHVI